MKLVTVSLGYSHEKGLVWNAMGTDRVRRGGTRGVRMNGHLCLAEEWLEQEGGPELLVLDLGKHYSHCSCLSKTYELHRYTSYHTSKYIFIVRTLYYSFKIKRQKKSPGS